MDIGNTSNGLATEESKLQTERPAEAAEPESAVRTESAPTAESQSDRDRLVREKAELQDLLQRRQAEFENFRRRVERERSDLFEFAAMDSVKALLPILDDFERALKVETADREYARGLRSRRGHQHLDHSPGLAHHQVRQRRRRHRQLVGQDHAVDGDAQLDSEIAFLTKDHPDQTILEEYQKGYYFKGRLLRPAMVKVAVNQ